MQLSASHNGPDRSSNSTKFLDTGIIYVSNKVAPVNIKTLTDTFKDREQRGVAALLTRFKTLVTLAASPVEDGATKEAAAAQTFQMEIESAALVAAAEDLLGLTRALKEMWLFGPLRGIHEGEGEGRMDDDSKVVGELVKKVLQGNLENTVAGSQNGTS